MLVLVRELPLDSQVRPILFVLVGIGAAIGGPVAGQSRDFPYRDAIVTGLERLILTGLPADNGHDDGEWLQRAVTYAIERGDRQIEQLAIRAAAPLLTRVTRPVSASEAVATDAPAFLEITSNEVLQLRTRVPYVAYIEAALDDGRFEDLDPQAFGEMRTIPLARLGPSALRPGPHHVRLRARLVFGDQANPLFEEPRDLMPVAYAIYDPAAAGPPDARAFTFAPAAVAARDLDLLLPEQPVARWLHETIAARGSAQDSSIMWTSRFCAERTQEHRTPQYSGGICTVALFDAGLLGQIWFRTGHLDIAASDATWTLYERPVVEAVIFSTGHVATRLSAVGSLLDQARYGTEATLPLSAPDIVVRPGAARVPPKAVVTLHNSGDVVIQNVLLQVALVDGRSGGRIQTFLIDVPALGSESVSLDMDMREPYGLVAAHVMLVGHGLTTDVMVEPQPMGLCAFQVVNPAAAPRGFPIPDTDGNLTGCLRR